MTFHIGNDNEIALLDTPRAAGAALPEETFSSSKAFTQAALEWPTPRLVDVWNRLARRVGLKPVQKFETKTIGIARIWKAAELLAADGTAAHIDAPSMPNTTAAKPKPDASEKAPRDGTAKANVIEMISRQGGATLDEIMQATGWKAHTVRGFISTLPKKGGPQVTSSRRESDKARVYEAAL